MSGSPQREMESLTPLHWFAIILGLLSGVIHLLVVVAGPVPPASTLGMLFILAFGGFVGGVALVIANYRRTVIYLLGIPFTGSQIVMWYLEVQPTGIGDIGAVDAVDKIAQLLLVVILTMLYLRER